MANNIRKVQATTPDGKTVDRQSKTKVYTHALALYFPEQDGYVVPAGTYTVPAKRIRGRNIKAYQTTVSRDHVVKGQVEHWGIASFHTSEAQALKSGQTWINQAVASARSEREIYGVDARAIATSFRAIPVEVLDEGFNA